MKDGVVTKYISAADMKVAQVRGTEVSYYHKDHLNSSTVMTNNSGTKVEETAYAPYGTMRAFTGTAVTNYRYTGKEIDPETNLYYYVARYYDPMMGRFITADSIVSDIYDPQDLNRYAYCRNNPMKYVDPDGHAADTVWDLVNIGMGIASFAYNVKTGNVSGAIVDAVGIVGDSAAAVVPFLPGGVATGIKAYRAADTAADALKAARTGGEAVEQTAKAGSKVTVAGAETAAEKGTAIQKYFPDNNGFLGATERQFLMKGDKIDRFGGSDSSRFFSPEGTPSVARSLPPGSAQQPLRTFEVVKPFEVESGTVAPAFGQLGLGTQYRAPVQQKILLDRGIIREVTP